MDLDDEQATSITIVALELRINKFRRPDYWTPSLAAMASLLASMPKSRHSGFLGQRVGLNRRDTTAIQYWSDAEGSHHRFELHGYWAPIYRRALQSHGAVGCSLEIHQTRRVDAALGPQSRINLALT